MFSPFSPVDIRILAKDSALDAAETLLHGARALCLIAGESMVQRLSLSAFVAGLLARHNGVWVKRVPANPSVSDISGVLQSLKGRPVDFILAIGGGSAMDLGKAVAALAGFLPEENLTEEHVRRTVADKTYAGRPGVPALIALPTTAGSGSEVTRWATVWDPEYRHKMSLDDVGLFPRAALVVPPFTVSMGPELTLSTGLDALSHAMEAFWAKSRTPLSQALATAAMERIKAALPKAVQPENAADLSLRQEMCLGALMAGLAFSITRTTACHAISYPLTMLHGLPHGMAAAVTLSAVLARNQRAVPEIQKIRELFAGENGLDAWLARLSAPVKPLRLSAFGIGEAELEAIAGLCFTAGRMDNNPVAFTLPQVLEILRESL